MASSDGSSDDWHTAGESLNTSKKSSSPWETIDSDDGAAPAARPPVPPSTKRSSLPPPTLPRGGDDSSSIGSHSSNVYMRVDGKKVRRVKKRRGSAIGNSSVASSVTSDDETTLCSMSASSVGSGVYFRADGKKVRRVKRKKKKKQPVVDGDIPASVSITSPTSEPDGAETTSGDKLEETALNLDSSNAPLQDEIHDKAVNTNVNRNPLAGIEGKEKPHASADESNHEASLSTPNDVKEEEITRKVEEKADKANDGPISGDSKPQRSTNEDGNKSIGNDGDPVSSPTPDDGKNKASVLNGEGKAAESTATNESQQVAETDTAKVQEKASPDPALASATQKALDGLSGKQDDDASNPWLVEPTDLQDDQIPSNLKETIAAESANAKKVDTSLDSLEEFVALVESAGASRDVNSINPLDNVEKDKDTTAEPAQPLQEYVMVQKDVETATDPQQSPDTVHDDGVILVPVESMDYSKPTDPKTSSTVTNEQTSSIEAPDRYEKKATSNHAKETLNVQDTGAAAQSVVLSAKERTAIGQPLPSTVRVDHGKSPHHYTDLETFPSADAVMNPETPDETNEAQGGRLWHAASKEATPSSPPPASTPNRRHLPDILKDRVTSRADVDAFVTPRTAITPVDRSRGTHMVRLDEDDDNLIMRTAFAAKKRVRVVQLLIFGLIGVAFGFLGSFYVQSSCHFLTATVAVGGNAEEFELHYGLWKYTPLSSAFEGYSYCYKYDVEYTSDSPVLPRIFGIVAIFLGMYSLFVLWVYLVLGRTNFSHWKGAVYASAASGIFQSLTLLFFAGSVCDRNSCSIGPGAAVSIVSALTWFVLAFEMRYNTPIMLGDEYDDDITSPDGIVANLEMSDVGDGMTAFFRRITNANGEDIPTLNQYRREKVESPPRANNSYVPPIYGEHV